MRDFLEFAGIMTMSLGLGLVVIIILTAPLVAIGVWVDSKACAAEWKNSGIESKYGFVSGCLVHDEKLGWVPADNYRIAR